MPRKLVCGTAIGGGCAFAEYFAGIGQKLAHSIPSTPHDAEIVLDTVDWNEHSIFLSPATQEEILSLINSARSKKAPGIDGIHPLVIKNCAQTIAPALTEIINNCILSGTYPDALKTARVVPIYKNGSKRDVENYRPVSVLPILNNIFERVICLISLTNGNCCTVWFSQKLWNKYGTE